MKTINPMDPIINKIADKGYDAQKFFYIIDDDANGVLTKAEI